MIFHGEAAQPLRTLFNIEAHVAVSIDDHPPQSVGFQLTMSWRRLSTPSAWYGRLMYGSLLEMTPLRTLESLQKESIAANTVAWGALLTPVYKPATPQSRQFSIYHLSFLQHARQIPSYLQCTYQQFLLLFCSILQAVRYL